MRILCRFPIRPTGAVAVLALSTCAPIGTGPTSFTAVEPSAMTPAAAAGVPVGADSNSPVMDGFIVDTGPPRPANPTSRYYVEFRSRWLLVYGHTYVVYGRLDNSGKPLDQHFVALYPRGGYLGLTAGTLPIPVPATTLPTSEDSQYDTLVAYRRPITAAQYEKIEQFVYETRSHDNVWNLYTVNCNYFAGEVATLVGLHVPPLSAQLTPLFVKELELLNQNG